MAKKPSVASTTPINDFAQEKRVQYVKLSELDFDAENPRFGRTAQQTRTQTQILDYIVQSFSVDDVLSSIAVNGFFVAEPLICREQDAGDRLTVVEGNRRLAACLILANDPRAVNQQRKVAQFDELRKSTGRDAFDMVPIIRFGRHEREKDLLSYLGVRHIAASQGWDSYAKAAWIAKAVEKSELTLKDISVMTGDQHRTVKRLLEGYYFVNQLIEGDAFKPENSLRRGRGSNPEFPFSWIYTLFGYQTARQYVNLDEEPKKKPIPADRLREARTLVAAMFGDKSSGRNAAIEDSREIGDLAAVLSSVEKTALLEKGKSVREIEFETQPVEQKLREALADCKDILSDLVSAVEATPPTTTIAEGAFPLARQVSLLASGLAKRLNDIKAGLADPL